MTHARYVSIATATHGAPHWRHPAELRVLWDDRERVPAGVLSCDVRLALDRPDLLEIVILESASNLHLSSVPGDDFPAPGMPVRIMAGEEPLFLGVVERWLLEDSVGEHAALRMVAASAFHPLREALSDTVHRNTTLAEIAGRIALRLGLVPEIDCPEIVFSEIRVEGDPLRFLRQLARKFELSLAVTGARMFLVRGLGDRGRCFELKAQENVEAVTVEYSRDRGRRARFLWRGIAPMRPLDRVVVTGHGRSRDGHYRVLRSALHADSSGWQSRVELASIDEAAPSAKRGTWR